MISNFVQPNSYSCVPTAFAYLAYKQLGADFKKTLQQILDLSEKHCDLKRDGMEFDQLQEVVQELGYEAQLSRTKPNVGMYLVGVRVLPKTIKYDPEIVEESIREGSLQLSDTEYVFPFGHAIVIMETEDDLKIFDSFAGTECFLAKDVLLKSLEENASYLFLK